MREPRFAGYFYPRYRKDLESMLASFFEEARKNLKKIDKKVIGLVVPHAGFIYSGKTASFGYFHLPTKIKTAVIIGPNHTGYGKKVSVYSKGKWKTPLGEVEIDEELSREIIENSRYAEEDEIAHMEEHSIEVQIPFLQYLYGNSFKIVPICLMDQSEEVAEDLSESILKTKKDFIIISSSDLTHYEDYKSVVRKDETIIEAIKSINLKNFYLTLRKIKATACGYGAIATLISITEKLNGKIELVKYSTSAETSRDYEHVVGYASLISYIE